MKRILLVMYIVLSAVCLTAQTASDSIIIKKKLGTVFQQNGRYLRPSQMVTIMQNNPEAAREMKIAKTNFDVGYVFGFAGGFMIGWPVGTSLGGGDPNWSLAYIGAGLAIISIPFSVSYTKHARNAVSIYNRGLRTSGLPEPSVNFKLSAGSIGLRVCF